MILFFVKLFCHEIAALNQNKSPLQRSFGSIYCGLKKVRGELFWRMCQNKVWFGLEN